MDMQSYSIPASQLRQYAYCPRIPWYMEVLGLAPARPIWVQQGERHHLRQTMLNRRRRLSRYGLTSARLHEDVAMRLDDHGIHGICDGILETIDAVYPLEFKLSDRRPSKGHLLQLGAYALMAERHFTKQCPRGFILYGDRGHTLPVFIDGKLRKWVENGIRGLRRCLESGSVPSSAATPAQCGQCEFLNFCNDRE